MKFPPDPKFVKPDPDENFETITGKPSEAHAKASAEYEERMAKNWIRPQAPAAFSAEWFEAIARRVEALQSVDASLILGPEPERNYPLEMFYKAITTICASEPPKVLAMWLRGADIRKHWKEKAEQFARAPKCERCKTTCDIRFPETTLGPGSMICQACQGGAR